jgi:hypothetical protein
MAEPPRSSRATSILRKTRSSVCRSRAARPMVPLTAPYQARLRAGAQRTLEAVTSKPLLGKGIEKFLPHLAPYLLKRHGIGTSTPGVAFDR